MVTNQDKPNQRKDRVIVALDLADAKCAKELVKKLARLVSTFKVGSELFTALGPKAIQMVRDEGKQVFLDLKFHDIPNTVARSVRAAVQLKVSMLTVHISGGLRMLKEACAASVDEAQKCGIRPPKLLGVTLLTSLSENALKNEVGISHSTEETVLRYAALAQKASLDGVVASPLEAKQIRKRFGKSFLIVTPGVRPSWASRDDQERALTPREAFDQGSSYLVVGRPVTQADDPFLAMERLLAELD